MRPVLGAVCAAVIAAGCGSAEADEPTRADARPLRPGAVTAPAPPEPAGSGPAPRPTESPPRPHGSTTDHTGTSWREVVDDVLDRYGAVLTEVAADPAALQSAGDLSARWAAVVVEGDLSDEIVGRALERLEQQRMVVLPGSDGRAYRHVAVDVEPVGDADRPELLSFTWCGYSPGVGVHVETGEVLDDDVAHATGTGTVRLVGDVWRLETLDQFELDLLGPGAPDPCSAP